MLKVKDVAERYSVSVSTIYRWVEEKKIPKPLIIGGDTIRWREADLDEWEAAGCPEVEGKLEQGVKNKVRLLALKESNREIKEQAKKEVGKILRTPLRKSYIRIDGIPGIDVIPIKLAFSELVQIAAKGIKDDKLLQAYERSLKVRLSKDGNHAEWAFECWAI